MDDRFIWFATGAIIGIGIIIYLAPLAVPRLRMSRPQMSLIAVIGIGLILAGLETGLRF